MLFNKRTGNNASTYGLVIDIGSGSIGAAIVASTQGVEKSEVLWSLRTQLPLRDAVRFEDVSKDLTTTLSDVLKEAGTKGIQALRKENGIANVTQALVRVASPWSYTVLKTARATHTGPFVVTPDLLDSLEERAVREATEACIKEENEPLSILKMTSHTTIGVSINGYSVKEASNKRTSDVGLTEVLCFVYASIADSITDTIGRSFPAASVSIHSALETYYTALSSLNVHLENACLVTVSGEATELAVVHDGILAHATYTPYGTRTLARELRDHAGISAVEALGYLAGEDQIEHKKNAEAIEEVFELFETNLVELFERAGDPLLLPKAIFLQADLSTQTFFQARIARALKRLSGSVHTVHTITPDHLSVDGEADLALLLSAHIFHTHTARSDA
ncbi:MAG: hypothetical protein WDZ93_03375 [Candidatus Paceibacterota bacterium]